MFKQKHNPEELVLNSTLIKVGDIVEAPRDFMVPGCGNEGTKIDKGTIGIVEMVHPHPSKMVRVSWELGKSHTLLFLVHGDNLSRIK